MDMIGAAWQGLSSVFHLDAFLLMMVGVVLGNIVGILPGLGGQFLLAMLIPFVFGMDPVSGMALREGWGDSTQSGINRT